MKWGKRAAFWSLAVAVLALISVPSVQWVESLRDYAIFASGWEPTPLKPTVTTFTPHDRAAEPEGPQLTSFLFKHRAPRAKAVELVGDFNAWKPGLLKMRRRADGLWSLAIPLRPGPHKYLFLEDGQPVVDSSAQTADGPEGRRVSLRAVQ